MAKLALCVFRDAALFDKPEQWVPFIKDRAEVDHPDKLDPNIKQLLPYVVLVNAYADAQHKSHLKVLTYIRGSAGDESRLHDLLSCGFGGHVDTEPKMVSLAQHLAEEAFREVKEELKIDLDIVRLRACINHTLRSKDFYSVEDREPVHSVHLGIPIYYFMSLAELVAMESHQAEEGVIKAVEWKKLEELNNPQGFEMEYWSQMAVARLTEDFAD